MERLFIYCFIGIALLFVILFFLFKKFFIDNSVDEEMNFSSGTGTSDPINSSISPAPREHIAYLEQQSGIFISAVKKAPKTIMTTVIIQISLMAFTGYLSVQNIERLAMAGSSLAMGDYGMAVSALWPIGKEAGVEQYRVARGVHEKCGGKGLVYVGKLNGKGLCILERPYSTQDHDEDLKETDDSYGNVLAGLSVSKAKDICKEKYNGELLSIEEWDFSRNHFLAARNVKPYSDIPEWTRNVSKDDSDDFLVIEKESGVRKYVIKKGIDNEENGEYVDGDDLSIAGFRCSKTW